VKWITRPSDCTNINVDADVAKMTAKWAVGIVCCSDTWVFLGVWTIVFHGITHPGSLEDLACREASDIVDVLLLGHICLASDFLEVVHCLHRENLGVFESILTGTKNIAQQRGGTSFKQEERVKYRSSSPSEICIVSSNGKTSVVIGATSRSKHASNHQLYLNRGVWVHKKETTASTPACM
jgi:hypothetical protein